MLTLLLQTIRQWITENLVYLGILEDITGYQGIVSIKSYGAVGDGVHDDSQALISALTASDTVYFPKGKYNLNNVNIAAATNHHINLIGENPSLVSILNGKIEAHYGITVKSITFDGGSPRWVASTTTYGDQYNAAYNGSKALLFVTPLTNNVEVEYYNCVFKNADMGSIAFFGVGDNFNDYELKKCIIDGCTFENIKHCAAFFWLSVDSCVITNNYFKNIGNTDGAKGDRIVALAVGDTSNLTTHGVQNLIVKNNVFEDLVTPFDTNSVKHSISANFIVTQGERITIVDNRFKNLTGFGDDREGVYTKGHYVEVGNNILEDCGTGEGYICCKPRAFMNYTDQVHYIHDNIIIGKYGAGISGFKSNKISGNYIAIEKAKAGIKCFAEGTTGIGACEIKDNQLSCGIGSYEYNGETITSYVVGDFIAVDKYAYGVKINDNCIVLHREDGDTTEVPSIIKTTNTRCNVDVVGNTITVDATLYGIAINSNSEYNPLTNVSELRFNVRNNIISTARYNGINFNISTLSVKKYITVKDNIVKSLTGSTSVSNKPYPLNVYDVSNNDSVLYYDSKQAASLFPMNKHVNTNIANVYTDIVPTEINKTSNAPVIVKKLNPNVVPYVDALPTASPNYLGQMYIYSGATTSTLYHGCNYECIVEEVVDPAEGVNPRNKGWYTLSNGVYRGTQDTSVQSGVTYYRFKWKQLTVSIEQLPQQ